MRKIDLHDGKYTIINELENGGGLRALRYGEEWRNLEGDNLVLSLFQELEEAKEEVERLREALERIIHVCNCTKWNDHEDVADSLHWAQLAAAYALEDDPDDQTF